MILRKYSKVSSFLQSCNIPKQIILPHKFCKLKYSTENQAKGSLNGRDVEDRILKIKELGTVDGYRDLGLMYYRGEEIEQDYPQAYKYLKMANDLGDHTSAQHLANMLVNGNGITQDVDEALRYCEKAAQTNNIDALKYMAYIYNDHKKEYERSISLYQSALHQGDLASNYHLGYFYARGLGVEKNEKLAFEHYNKAAEGGHVISMRKLGFCYMDGIGTDKNLELSRKFFQMASDRGDMVARVILRSNYQEANRSGDPKHKFNTSSTRNVSKTGNVADRSSSNTTTLTSSNITIQSNISSNLQHSATDTKNPSMNVKPKSKMHEQLQLGFSYERGVGISKDIHKAIEIYKEISNAESLRRLAKIYFLGNDIPQDYEQALKYFLLSSSLGNEVADYYLSMIYLNGYGVKKDIKKALEYKHSAAEKGEVRCMNELGIFYSEGKHVPQDFKKSLQYFQKAADLGDPKALFYLGKMYEEGNGVPINYQQALSYFKHSADKGNLVAISHLGYIYLNGIDVEKDEKLALKYIHKAAKQDFVPSLRELAFCYLNGVAVEPNKEVALQYFTRAASKGDDLSRNMVKKLTSPVSNRKKKNSFENDKFKNLSNFISKI